MARLKTDAFHIVNSARVIERFAWQIQEQESTTAAIAWLGERTSILNKESGTTPETKAYWHWLESFTHARAAGYQRGTPAEISSRKKSNALLFKSLPVFPQVFKSPRTTPDKKLRMLTSLLEAGAADTARQNDDEWIALILELTPLLSEEEQIKISALLPELIPDTDSRYLALKTLIKP